MAYHGTAKTSPFIQSMELQVWRGHTITKSMIWAAGTTGRSCRGTNKPLNYDAFITLQSCQGALPPAHPTASTFHYETGRSHINITTDLSRWAVVLSSNPIFAMALLHHFRLLFFDAVWLLPFPLLAWVSAFLFPLARLALSSLLFSLLWARSYDVSAVLYRTGQTRKQPHAHHDARLATSSTAARLSFCLLF